MRVFSILAIFALFLGLLTPVGARSTNAPLALAPGEGRTIKVSARGRAIVVVQSDKALDSKDRLTAITHDPGVASAQVISVKGHFAFVEIDGVSHKPGTTTTFFVTDGTNSASGAILVVAQTDEEIAKSITSSGSAQPEGGSQIEQTKISKGDNGCPSLPQSALFAVNPDSVKISNKQTATLTIELTPPTPGQRADQLSTPTPTPAPTPTPVPIVGSDNVSVVTVPSPPTVTTGNSGAFTVGITASRPGSACVTVSFASLGNRYVPVNVLPREFMLSGGVAFDTGETSNTYSLGVTGASPSPAATELVQTARTHAQINGLVLAHFAITHNPNAANLWGSVGSSGNSQGLVYGLSLSPARSDSIFFTAGLRQNVSQQPLPGLTPGQVVPSGVTAITYDQKRPVLFFGVTGDISQLGCILSAITGGGASLSNCK